MSERWSEVKHYTVLGWRKTSWPALVVWFLGLAGLAFWTPGPFWLVFPSLTPFLFLYFLTLGFLLEMLDRDWKDWHLW